MTGLGMGALSISLSSRGLWSSGRGDLLPQINAPATVGDCFAQGPHSPSSFFHGTTEEAHQNYSSSPLAMTGNSGIGQEGRLPHSAHCIRSIRNDNSLDRGSFFTSCHREAVGFQPKRSPAADRGTSRSWRLLRSGAAHPKLLFHGTTEEAYRNYSPSPLAMTGISGMELIGDQPFKNPHYPLLSRNVPPMTSAAEIISKFLIIYCPSSVSP